MKFEMERNGIRIIPQTEQDKAYIEDTLGLREANESVRLRRVPWSFDLPRTIAYLSTEDEHYGKGAVRLATDP